MTKGGRMQMPRKYRGLTITFGLVNIPVAIGKMYDENGVSGHMVCAEHKSRIGMEFRCKEGGEVVARSDCAIAYEHGGSLVLVDEAERAACADDRDQMVRIEKAVPLAQIDPLYFEKPYLMWVEAAQPDSVKQGLGLLVETARREKVAFVGRCVLDKSERMVVLLYSDETKSFNLYICRFHESVRHEHVAAVRAQQESLPKPDKAALTLAKQVVDSIRGDFNPETVVDGYRFKLRERIEANAADPEKVLVAEQKGGDERPAPDIMEQLRAQASKSRSKKKVA